MSTIDDMRAAVAAYIFEHDPDALRAEVTIFVSERQAQAVKVTLDLKPEPAPKAYALGRWHEEDDGCWSRGDSAPDSKTTPACLLEFLRGEWHAIVWTDGCRREIGTYPTRSAAMLGVDAWLREAGVSLPETVYIGEFDGGDAILYSASDEAWTCGDVYPVNSSHRIGTASTIDDAFNVLDDHGVDTAIARAQLEERATEPLNVLDDHGVDTAIARAQLEERATEPLPLAGVVLSGVWEKTLGDDSLLRMTDTADTVLTICDGLNGGAWMIFRSGAPIATGIGTREDALAKARELGAEVTP